jgi:hypothetical protein
MGLPVRCCRHQAGSLLDEHCSISYCGMTTSTDMAPANLNTVGQEEEEEETLQKVRRRGLQQEYTLLNHQGKLPKSWVHNCQRVCESQSPYQRSRNHDHLLQHRRYQDHIWGNVFCFPDGIATNLLFATDCLSISESIVRSSSYIVATVCVGSSYDQLAGYTGILPVLMVAECASSAGPCWSRTVAGSKQLFRRCSNDFRKTGTGSKYIIPTRILWHGHVCQPIGKIPGFRFTC